jgi:hypothetical protein
MIPFPGTPYYEEMKAAGWLTAEGEPDMPQFRSAEIRAMAKKAYRRFYISPRFAWRCLCHPYENVLSRLKTYRRAIPAVLWRKWQTANP